MTSTILCALVRRTSSRLYVLSVNRADLYQRSIAAYRFTKENGYV